MVSHPNAKVPAVFLGSVWNLESELQAKVPVQRGEKAMIEMLVIFAHWCPVCQMMMPIVRELEVDYADILRVVKIDAQQHPEEIEKYEVQIVPTFLLQKEGEHTVRMAGMIGETVLRERIELLNENRL